MARLKRLYRFVRDVIKASQDDDLIPYAHQLTLSMILAFFPFVMFLFTLLGFLNIDTAPVLDALARVLPQSVYPDVAEIVVDVVDRQRSGLLSLSAILAIYAASGGFRAYMKSSNRVAGVTESRHILWVYLLSIAWVVLFALTLAIALLAVVFGNQLAGLIRQAWPHFEPDWLVAPLRLALTAAFMVFVITLFYMFGPAVRFRFLQALPGAVFTMLAWVGLTVAFQYYVDNIANYSRFYGTLGALIAFLIWLQLIATILLFGAEINAVLIARRVGGNG